jgi:Uma2 family endonuclease
MTAEQLARLPDDGFRSELVRGELRKMAPAGWRHGKVVGRLHTMLGHHVQQGRLGTIFGAETGFLLERNPDTVRAPDIAFLSSARQPAEEPQEAFWPGPPDLAVEVISPSDTTGEVDEEVKAWLRAGTGLVWIVDPEMRSVTVFRSETDIQTKTATSELSGEDVIEGFRCGVDEIFG